MSRSRQEDQSSVHIKILKKSLRVLIKLLPKAIKEFRKKPSGRTAYPITNIISEIRNLIAQIESSVDQAAIVAAVSQAVAVSLRGAISQMATHIISTKKALPLKIKDTASRRAVTLSLDQVLKEFERIMSDIIPDIENRVYTSVQKELKNPTRGSTKSGKSKKKKKRER